VGGGAPDKLLGASSEVAGRVELHTMEMEGDVMRMREVGTIEVPAGKTVELKPGGLHIMFMDLKKPLANGSSFPLTLRFEKAGEMKINVQVQSKAPAGSASGMDHGKHGGHGEHKHKH
jgi:copper(I)-binding protein